MAAPAPARDGIGGTDIAAIVGVSPYRSSFDVWARIVGGIDTTETNEAMEWGSLLEPVIGGHYNRRHPDIYLTQPGHLRHPTIPWIVGTPDYLVHPADAGQGAKPVRGLEVKTAGMHAREQWGEQADAIPEHYLIQCAWYQILTELATWDVAVLIGGQTYREYTLVRDRELTELLQAHAEKFWTRHVVPRIPPEPGASEQTSKAIKAMWRRSVADMREATPEETAVAFTLMRAERELAEAQEWRNGLVNRLKVAIGDGEGLVGPFGAITWRSTRGWVQTDYAGIVAELKPPPEVIARHSKEVPGVRRFLTKWTTP